MRQTADEIVEDKYNIKIIRRFKNKYNEEFIECLDLEDNETFTVDVRPGEYLQRTFERVFGKR